jgi:hypothetical protein
MLSLSIYCADTLENATAILGGIPLPSILSDTRIPQKYLIGIPDTIQKDLTEIAFRRTLW